MKITPKLIMLFVLTCIYQTGFAQSTQPVSATATVSAVIVAPLAITHSTDLSFGNISVGSSVGTVTMTPAGVRSVTGSCQLSPTNTGSPTPAAFAVTGQGSYTYSITLPSSATTITGAGTAMTVDTYVSTPSGTGTLTAGAQTVSVGGTLHVGVSQTPGTYTLASGLSVAVIYN